MTSSLAYALWWAQNAGYAVLPLSVRKLPIIASPHKDDRGQRGQKCRGECGTFGHGVHDASSDPDVILRMWQHTGGASGFGIACGHAQDGLKLVGLDIDMKGGVDGEASLKQLQAEHGFRLPGTATVATPTGGRHLWLTVPADITVRNSASSLGPGIDIRGTGGYLVGPGSWANAGQYVMTRMDAAQPAPAQFIDLIRHREPERPTQPLLAPGQLPTMAQLIASQGHTRARTGRDLVPLVDFVLRLQDGNRNTGLYWAACRAFEVADEAGLPHANVEAALVDAAGHIGLGEGDARSTIRSAYQSARRAS